MVLVLLMIVDQKKRPLVLSYNVGIVTFFPFPELVFYVLNFCIIPTERLCCQSIMFIKAYLSLLSQSSNPPLLFRSNLPPAKQIHTVGLWESCRKCSQQTKVGKSTCPKSAKYRTTFVKNWQLRRNMIWAHLQLKKKPIMKR